MHLIDLHQRQQKKSDYRLWPRQMAIESLVNWYGYDWITPIRQTLSRLNASEVKSVPIFVSSSFISSQTQTSKTNARPPTCLRRKNDVPIFSSLTEQIPLTWRLNSNVLFLRTSLRYCLSRGYAPFFPQQKKTLWRRNSWSECTASEWRKISQQNNENRHTKTVRV